MEVFSGSQFRRRSCGEQILLNSELRDVQVIALFYSSRWCYTSRLVASLLAETYKELKRDKHSFEVVFLSGDHTEEDAKAFASESHLDWLSVPFNNQTIELLYSRYGVNQLPCLVLINQAGELITASGVRDVVKVGAESYSSWKEGKASTTKDEELGDYHERLCSGCCLLPWGQSTVNREAFLASSSAPSCLPPLHLLNGKMLERKSGSVMKTEEALQGVQVVVVCFWAKWCTTCSEVLLPLSECYRSWKADNLPVELVFVKLDYCEGPKDSFMDADFPEWLVVPYETDPGLGDNSLIRQLFTKFGALRVPLALVLKKNGEVITVEGFRDMMTKGASAAQDWIQGKASTCAGAGPDYPEDVLHDGCCFLPWAVGMIGRRSSFSHKICVCPCPPVCVPPPRLPWQSEPPALMLNNVRLVRNTSRGLEEVSPVEITKAQVVAYYFAAHWCPPCRKFTPILANVYRKLMIEAVPVEVVFISWDEDGDVMKGHMQESHANWLGIAYDDISSRDFTALFDVDRIPHLYIVSKAGEMITTRGIRDVCLKDTSAAQCWLNGKAATTDEDQFDETLGPGDAS